MTADYQKKLFIKNYGCQMNVYDAERMQDVLAGHGFVAGASADDADLILLNTCHIREKATEKIFSELGRLNILKKQRFDRDGVNVMIGVVGCVAQAEGEYILERAPIVDLVIGPQAYHRLPELLQIAARDGQALATDFAVADKFDYLAMSENSIKNNNYPDAGKIKAVSSFVSVQEGCDKFCTFCVVPYTRGAEFSRPLEQIVNEVKMLLDRGVCEFTLLGQNVNAYHGTNSAGTTLSLGDLLYELAELPGVRRLRYTTSHPRDMDDQLINAHRDIKQLMPFLHLPVQSGSDKILKAMNRRHDVDLYHDVIARVRRACPDIAVSGDFIVGFPGETDADFAATMELVGKINYAQAYSFKYSARPGTPAADRDDQVPEAVKSMRLSQLQNLLRQQQLEFNQKMLGQTLPVLLERPGRYPGQVAGRTPYMQPVHIDGDNSLIGTIADINVTGVNASSLTGNIATIIAGNNDYLPICNAADSAV